MSLILSKQSGRLNAGLTKLPHSAGCKWNYSPKVEDVHLTGT